MLWWKHYLMLSQKFARLRQLDAYLAPLDATEDLAVASGRQLSLYQKVEKGMYTISDLPTELGTDNRNNLTTCQTGNIVVSMEHCNYIAEVGMYPQAVTSIVSKVNCRPLQ